MGLIGDMLLLNYFQIWTALRYIIYFWIGMEIRKYGDNTLKRIPIWAWVLIFTALFYFTALLSRFETLPIKIVRLAMQIILHGVGAIMAFLVLQWTAERCRWKNKMFLSLSTKSMTIYLFHQQFIYFTISWLNGAVNPYVNVAINLLGALLVSFAISLILQKWKVTRFLVGEK